MKGSAGGTLRGLTIGGYATESASITPWLSFTNTGAATFTGTTTVSSSAATLELRSSGSGQTTALNIYDQGTVAAKFYTLNGETHWWGIYASYFHSSNNTYLFGGSSNSYTGRVSLGAVLWNNDTIIERDAANILAQRNSTNAQTFRVYGTWTSTTSYERLNIKGKAAANFEIGPENGSAGGTLRGLTIGGYSAGTTTIAPWLTFTNAGVATFAGAVSASNLSGTNTGDQDLSSYLTSATAASTYVALTGAQTIAGSKTFTSTLVYQVEAPLSQTYKCYNDTTTNGTQFICQRARGTLSVPLYPLASDVFVGHYAYGWDQSTGAFTTLRGSLACSAADDWTDTGNGTQWTWQTTPIDTKVLANRMRLHADGALTVGGIVSTGGLVQLVGTNTAATGFGTATNRLRFTDTDNSVLANQPLGEIEFYSSDASPTAAGVRACFGAYTESSALSTAFVWGLGASNATPLELMRLTSTGRLGIGITAPSALLHIAVPTSATVTTAAIFGNGSSDSGSGSIIYLTSGSSTTRAVAIAAINGGSGGNEHSMVFYTNSTGASPVEAGRFSSVGLFSVEGGIKTSKGVYQTTETTSTPAAGAVTIDLTLNNHQTLSLTSLAALGTSQVTFAPPTGSSAGTLIVKQHASASKDITTWAVTGGTIKWMGTEPNWVGDAATNLRVVSWRWDGSIMYLAATDVGT
jgi:hypothetical protein